MRTIEERVILTLFVALLPYIGECIGQGPTIEVQAVISRTASLPCNIRPPMKNDSAILVVWYRNEMDAIYSYDSRRKNATHWWNVTVIGNRAIFLPNREPAATLDIQNVQPSDAGVYRCRVDFQKSPTKNHKISVQVIVPPEKPIIYDERRRKVTTRAGPFEENSDVKFICSVRGGSPTPTLRWYNKGALLESTITKPDHELVESELVVRRISRDNLNAQYTCHASNTNMSEPQETFVIIDMYLTPLNVTISSGKQSLSADRKYEIVCQATGSHPPANITWSKDGERLLNFNQTISANANGEYVTNSTLTLTPSVDDLNRTLVCLAKNDRIRSGASIRDSWVLDIAFPPVVTLQFGTLLTHQNDIKEGDNVFFQCNIYSNPRVYKVVWKRNGVVVQQDSGRVDISWTKLELKAVKRNQSGNYTCFASNVEGDSESNAFELKIMYKPMCKSGQKEVYGLAKNESATISCEVDAYPYADSFVWSFNNSEDVIGRRRRSERKRNTSLLNISPVSDADYGHVECLATNKAGEQEEPCVFRLVPAGRPQAPHNCTTVNQTSSSLGVECLAGFDGGLSPLFVLTVYEDSRTLIANLTSPTPSFLVDGLTSGTSLTMNLYAENGRGLSPAVIIEGSTLNSAEKRTGSPSSMNFSPYIVLLIGMTVFCSISAIVILGAVRAHSLFGADASQCCFRANRGSSSATIKQNHHLSGVQQSLKFDIIEDEDKNPDVVPNKKEDNYEILQLSRDDTNVSPEYYYANKKSRKSPSMSSSSSPPPPPLTPTPPSPPSPLLLDKNAASSWQLTKTLHRNGDVRKKRKNAPTSDSPVDFADLTRRASSVKTNNTTQQDRDRCSESSKQMRLENAAPCNVIRMSSPKEIVTVRTPLIRTQESCV